MRNITFKLKNGKTHEMSVDEMARWACLIEGVQFVADKCEEIGLSKDSEEWIKPLAFQKYIDERFEAMRHDIKVEVIMGRI
jgi:disulfide oxidoreductase YuzD